MDDIITEILKLDPDIVAQNNPKDNKTAVDLTTTINRVLDRCRVDEKKTRKTIDKAKGIVTLRTDDISIRTCATLINSFQLPKTGIRCVKTILANKDERDKWDLVLELAHNVPNIST